MIDYDWEMRSVCAGFRAVAERWGLSAPEVARLLDVEVGTAEPLLRTGTTLTLSEAAETRLRLAIEVDRGLGLSGFDALVWLRLDGSPSRLARMSASLDGMREVRREADGA